MAIRVQNVKLIEGLKVVDSMIETGRLLCDSKHLEFHTIATLPGKHRGSFVMFKEILQTASLEVSTDEPRFDIPLHSLHQQPYVKFYGLTPAERNTHIKQTLKNAREDE